MQHYFTERAGFDPPFEKYLSDPRDVNKYTM